MGSRLFVKFAVAGTLVSALAACQPPEFLGNLGANANDTGTADAPAQSVKLIERDVEAPDVYQTTDPALWDGRPSLGGVWVAAPGVTDPERVIIRNPSNGKFVIGALFKKERQTTGPALQLSSDAAAALGVLAGAPTEINVTALRREEVPDPAAAPVATAPAATGGEAAPTSAVASSELDDGPAAPSGDPLAAAAAAIDRAAPAATPTRRGSRPAARPARAASPLPVATNSSLARPFVQVGIFSVEENARNTATALRGAGIVPTVLAQESRGKKFWRVIVGPAQSGSERSQILRTITRLGFADAYAVTN